MHTNVIEQVFGCFGCLTISVARQCRLIENVRCFTLRCNCLRLLANVGCWTISVASPFIVIAPLPMHEGDPLILDCLPRPRRTACVGKRPLPMHEGDPLIAFVGCCDAPSRPRLLSHSVCIEPGREQGTECNSFRVLIGCPCLHVFCCWFDVDCLWYLSLVL